MAKLAGAKPMGTTDTGFANWYHNYEKPTTHASLKCTRFGLKIYTQNKRNLGRKLLRYICTRTIYHDLKERGKNSGFLSFLCSGGIHVDLSCVMVFGIL